MDNSYDQIESADVVVASGTFAYIAVARGVPTVMMAERSLPEHWLKTPTVFAPNWNKYVNKMAYPLDILNTKDTKSLFIRAIAGDDKVRDWRRRMIGDDFCADKFIEVLESYI